ncbi:unnamed protein product [Parajaminaea phylloscopi]
MATQSALRVSCRFCRDRKIRCSGAYPCTACTTRKIQCVRDGRAKMGRPRRARPHSERSPPRDVALTMGTALELLHRELFLSQQPLCVFSQALQAFFRERALSVVPDGEDEATQTPCPVAVYSALLPLMALDIIESCCTRLDPTLGLRRDQYFATALVRDSTAGMYDGGDASATATPSVSREDIHRWQIDNPLSCLVAQSHLDCVLAEGRDDASVEALRLIVAGEVSSEPEQGQTLLSMAERAFASVPMSDDAAHNEAAAAVASLLAVNCLCRLRARQGATYLAFAGQLAGGSAQTQAGRTLRRFLYSSTLWAFLQLDVDDASLLGAMQVGLDGLTEAGGEQRAPDNVGSRQIWCVAEAATQAATALTHNEGGAAPPDAALSLFSTATGHCVRMSQAHAHGSSTSAPAEVATVTAFLRTLIDHVDGPRPAPHHRLAGKADFALAARRNPREVDFPMLHAVAGLLVKVAVHFLCRSHTTGHHVIAVAQELDHVLASSSLASLNSIRDSRATLAYLQGGGHERPGDVTTSSSGTPDDATLDMLKTPEEGTWPMNMAMDEAWEAFWGTTLAGLDECVDGEALAEWPLLNS